MAKKTGRRLKEKFFFSNSQQLFLIAECLKKIDRKINLNTVEKLSTALDTYSSVSNCKDITIAIFNPMHDKNERHGLLHEDAFYYFVKAIKANIPYYWDKEALVIFLKFVGHSDFITYAKVTSSELRLSQRSEYFVGKRFSVHLIDDPYDTFGIYAISKYIIEFTSVITVNLIRYNTETGKDEIISGSFEVANDDAHIILDFEPKKNLKTKSRLILQMPEESPKYTFNSNTWFGRFFLFSDETFFHHVILGLGWEKEVDFKSPHYWSIIENFLFQRNVIVNTNYIESPSYYYEKISYKRFTEKPVISDDALKILTNHNSLNSRMDIWDKRIASKKYGFDLAPIIPTDENGIVRMPISVNIAIPSWYRPKFNDRSTPYPWRHIEWEDN